MSWHVSVTHYSQQVESRVMYMCFIVIYFILFCTGESCQMVKCDLERLTKVMCAHSQQFPLVVVSGKCIYLNVCVSNKIVNISVDCRIKCHCYFCHDPTWSIKSMLKSRTMTRPVWLVTTACLTTPVLAPWPLLQGPLFCSHTHVCENRRKPRIFMLRIALTIQTDSKRLYSQIN